MFLSEDFVLPLISTKYSRIIICNVVDSFDVINLEKVFGSIVIRLGVMNTN